MEYFRTEESKIYADMAYRIGKLVEQYKNFNQDEKFEVTLNLMSLQSLLTIFEESKVKNNEKFFNREISHELNDVRINFGISKSAIKENTMYSDSVTLKQFLKSIRNAMSHPVAVENEKPQTGYRSSKDEYDGHIESIIFTHSPPTNKHNNPKTKTFQVELTVKEIKALVIGLSNFLAQPIQEKWDGQTITRLVG